MSCCSHVHVCCQSTFDVKHLHSLFNTFLKGEIVEEVWRTIYLVSFVAVFCHVPQRDLLEEREGVALRYQTTAATYIRLRPRLVGLTEYSIPTVISLSLWLCFVYFLFNFCLFVYWFFLFCWRSSWGPCIPATTHVSPGDQPLVPCFHASSKSLSRQVSPAVCQRSQKM